MGLHGHNMCVLAKHECYKPKQFNVVNGWNWQRYSLKYSKRTDTHHEPKLRWSLKQLNECNKNVKNACSWKCDLCMGTCQDPLPCRGMVGYSIFDQCKNNHGFWSNS